MTDFDQFDEINSPRQNANDFSQIIDKAVTRRNFLTHTSAIGVAAFVSSTRVLSAPAQANNAKTFNFSNITASTADTIKIPDQYQWSVLISWGDPLFSLGEPFDPKTRGTAKSQILAMGDNNDGMALFPVDQNNLVMAVNNEYVNRDIFYANQIINNAEMVEKGKYGHGVSIFNLTRKDGQWQVQIDGPQNRRITAETEMEITGPARAHALMKTSQDPSGTHSKGTWNNCGNGQTPWGTYLTCEENFNGYFGSTNQQIAISKQQKRYGISAKDWGYHWYQFDHRFDIAKEPNEPNRSGYIVEIDPMNPKSRAKKRTALGRFKHENAEVVIADNRHVVVYLGDDERGEHLYRFISKGKYIEGNAKNNANLLEEGTLYVAKFRDADTHQNKIAGTGQWIALVHGENNLNKENGFTSQAEIAIFTRLAASKVGATTMDRPEWVASNPNKAEVYCALTNNKYRGRKPNAGGFETPVGGPNPRQTNLYGQIVRWRPEDGDHTATDFNWDLFVLAGNPNIHTNSLNRGSDNINTDNMFNAPDGLSFDADGRLWIQTDGKNNNKGDFVGMGNNQMLVGDPDTGEIRRFLVGPIASEVTGLCWSPDQKAMFVGIQHPGVNGNTSHFPAGGDSLARSSVIVITRKDGGVIGA